MTDELIRVFAITAMVGVFYPFAKRGLQEIIIDLAEIIAWVLSKIIK